MLCEFSDINDGQNQEKLAKGVWSVIPANWRWCVYAIEFLLPFPLIQSLPVNMDLLTITRALRTVPEFAALYSPLFNLDTVLLLSYCGGR